MRLGSKAVLKHAHSKRWRAGEMSFEFRTNILAPLALLKHALGIRASFFKLCVFY
jgi:hypothetical protein